MRVHFSLSLESLSLLSLSPSLLKLFLSNFSLFLSRSRSPIVGIWRIGMNIQGFFQVPDRIFKPFDFVKGKSSKIIQPEWMMMMKMKMMILLLRNRNQNDSLTWIRLAQGKWPWSNPSPLLRIVRYQCSTDSCWTETRHFFRRKQSTFQGRRLQLHTGSNIFWPWLARYKPEGLGFVVRFGRRF